MGFEAVEFDFEVFHVSLFSFAKGTLAGARLASVLLRGEQKQWVVRCSILRFPPTLRRCEIVLFIVAASALRWIVRIDVG